MNMNLYSIFEKYDNFSIEVIKIDMIDFHKIYEMHC